MSEKTEDRPRLFVGSSTDSLDFAYAIQQNLEGDAEVTVWKQGVFELTKSVVEALNRTLDRSDFAIFVFAPTDVVHIRQKKYSAVRDNVIFELGLFMGKLGRPRTFIVCPKANHSLRIPTDLTGLTLGMFDSRRKDKNLEAAFGPFCSQVRKEIRRLGPRVTPRARGVTLHRARQALKRHATNHVVVDSSKPSDSAKDSIVLERPRVPFLAGQGADFLLKELPRGCHGFKLKLALPKETYWRAGFLLAPEDYIREGRSDIDIKQYFLFHVGRGSVNNPTQSTELHYQAYYNGGPLTNSTPFEFQSGDLAELDVGLTGGAGCHVTVSFGGVRYETKIDSNYTRFLYLLAWADRLTPFRVPIAWNIS